jgi:hypothetical protein
MTTLFICGDIVNYEHADGHVSSEPLAELISSADYGVCNFEAPVEGHGTPQPKSGVHHFQKRETINGLKDQGFHLLLLANNHMMDFGSEGLAATMEGAKEKGLDTLGAGLNSQAAYEPLIKEIKGLKIGMINACEAQFGVIDYFKRHSEAGYAWINHSLIDKTIIRLRRKCDFVLVFAHAGLENYGIPQKEWRERYRHLCDLGADVVVGSHPHVPQGYEQHGCSLIFYSLGNFYFDAKHYKNKEDGSFSVWLELSREKPPAFKPVFHYKKDGLVWLAPKGKRVDLIKLCDLLGDEYEKEHDRMSLEACKMIRRSLKSSLMLGPLDGHIKSAFRRLLAKVFMGGKTTDNNILLLHLLRNESYYFAAKHALEVKVKERLVK